MTRQDYDPNTSLLWGSIWTQRRDILEPNPDGPDEDYWFSNNLLVYRPEGQTLWTANHRTVTEPPYDKDTYLEQQGDTPEEALRNLLGDPVQVLHHLYYPMNLPTSPERAFRNGQAPSHIRWCYKLAGGWSCHRLIQRATLYTTPTEAVLAHHQEWELAEEGRARDWRAHRWAELHNCLAPLRHDRAVRGSVAKWFQR